MSNDIIIYNSLAVLGHVVGTDVEIFLAVPQKLVSSRKAEIRIG